MILQRCGVTGDGPSEPHAHRGPVIEQPALRQWAADLRSQLGLDAEFLQELTAQRFLAGLTLLHLAAWELPHPRKLWRGGSPGDQQARGALEGIDDGAAHDLPEARGGGRHRVSLTTVRRTGCTHHPAPGDHDQTVLLPDRH